MNYEKIKKKTLGYSKTSAVVTQDMEVNLKILMNLQ